LDDRTYPGDVEVTARVRIDSWADGDLARAGIGLATDPLTGRGYNLVFHSRGGSRNNVEFLDDGVRWGNRYAFNWNLDTWYWFKLKDVDGVLYGKIWQDGAAEPTAWQFTQSGWSGRPGGAPALNGGAASAGGGSAAVSFDDVTVRSPAATATAPPTGLTAAAVSIDQVNLSWHASAGATGYRVERTVGGTTAWTPVAQLGAGTIAYADTGLLSGSAYSYRVVATGPAGDSNPSGVVTATTGTPTTLFHDDFSSPTLGAAWSLRGGAWGQFQSVFSQRSTASGDPKKAMLTNQAYPAALEVSARVRVDGWVDGDYARAGIGLSTDPVTGRGFNLVFRSSGGSRNHVAFLDDGVRWGQTHDFAWSLNTWYRFKLKAINGSLYGKVWADGSAEPVGWMFVQSGWSSRTGGAPSLNGGSALTGNGTATVSFDDVTVTGA
jgi:hypothetical protein